MTGTRLGKGRIAGKLLALAVACIACCGVVAQSAGAAGIGFTEFGASLSSQGAFSRQAGGHPDLRVKFRFATTGSGDSATLTGSPRDVRVDLPLGMVGDPTNFGICPAADLAGGPGGVSATCPTASQVGIATVWTTPGPEDLAFSFPVYSVEHPGNMPALFGFNVLGAISLIEPQVDPRTYGISSLSPRISQGLPVYAVDLTLWGVPADPSHDLLRAGPGGIFGAASPLPPAPFLTSPTSCPGTPQALAYSADSWEEPGVFVGGAVQADPEGTPFTFEGCERVPFEPSVRVQPSSYATNSPTGLQVRLDVPQSEAPRGVATAQVRKTVVTMPKGFAINPAAAVGQAGCSQAQIGIGSNDPPTCPTSSQLGSVKIQTPILNQELEGNVYLARQHENPFGSLLALYLGVKGPGFYLKLPGKVELDPVTGQVVTTFDNTPQLPFESLSLSLRNGTGAPLTTPSTCGAYDAQVQMTSWASPVPVNLHAPIEIDEGCAATGFSPKLRAGTVTAVGGSYSAFTLEVTRADGEQNLSRIQATLPPGLLARLAGVPLCGDAQAATGACPAASQVGTTTVGVGAGTNPLFVPEAGKAPTAVYLAGPYKGAPYSLVVKVPAQAGPFDLGTVVVRNALHIDPVTTQVTTESDPLPQILEGIPVSYRDVRVEVNRPEFTLNPTNCSQFAVTSVLTSAAGQTAGPKAPFAAANCERLGLRPKLAIRFSGAPTRRGGHPRLTATLTTKKGDANLRQVQVTLPRTEFLENAHIKTVCTRVQFAADRCPARSVYGHAKAWTPLLDRPLEGPVYLRSSNHTLPDLVASLDGQIHVDLDGRISSYKSRIRNTFETVPDAPVTKFVLTMQGGGKGLLVNNTDLCRARPTADVVFDGQNGKTEETNPVVSVGGCGKGRKAAGKK
jgi:hypothetical protein